MTDIYTTAAHDYYVMHNVRDGRSGFGWHLPDLQVRGNLNGRE